MEELQKELAQIADDRKVYEVGYHIIPTISAERLGAEVTRVRDVLESESATVIADEYPKHLDLAFPIVKIANNKRATYTSAYFGWIKFEATGKGVKVIDTALKMNENVLRFIIVKTVRENTIAPKKLYQAKREDERPEAKPEAKPEVVMTEEELDKTIEELVIN